MNPWKAIGHNTPSYLDRQWYVEGVRLGPQSVILWHLCDPLSYPFSKHLKKKGQGQNTLTPVGN